jgi:hypothetical protein
MSNSGDLTLRGNGGTRTDECPGGEGTWGCGYE